MLVLFCEHDYTLHIIILFVNSTLENVFHRLRILVICSMRHQLPRFVYAALDKLICARDHLGVMGVAHGRNIVDMQASQMPLCPVETDLTAVETANDELTGLHRKRVSQLQSGSARTEVNHDICAALCLDTFDFCLAFIAVRVKDLGACILRGHLAALCVVRKYGNLSRGS